MGRRSLLRCLGTLLSGVFSLPSLISFLLYYSTLLHFYTKGGFSFLVIMIYEDREGDVYIR
jgi:hypothetical protein